MGTNTKQPKKKVWIKCRAHEACEGQEAEIMFSQHVGGQLDSMSAGRVIRYKCCACGQSFHVRQ
jgi:hypothetical protein